MEAVTTQKDAVEIFHTRTAPAGVQMVFTDFNHPAYDLVSDEELLALFAGRSPALRHGANGVELWLDGQPAETWKYPDLILMPPSGEYWNARPGWTRG